MVDKARLDQTFAARDRYLRGLGAVAPDVIAPLVNPSFQGGPEWPDLRQAWRVITTGAHTILVSDGLTDPFKDDPKPNVGFGLEVLVETDDLLPRPIQKTWLFEVVYEISQNCADHGGIRELIDRLKLLSLELPSSRALGAVATASGSVGVLLGVAPPGVATEFAVPGGSVRLLTAKVLMPTELAFVAKNGAAGREELAKRFAAQGTHHRSSLKRKAVA